MKKWNYKLNIALGVIVLVVTVFCISFFQKNEISPSASAGWNGNVTITKGGQSAIDYFCKNNADQKVCTDKDYISSTVGNAYSLLKKYISDYANVAKIGHIYIMSPIELKEFCGSKTAFACWDFKDIAVTYENFTYSDEQKSYSVVAHEMLHAYATGNGFNLYPLEEGIVDSLSYEIPEMSVYKNVGYPEIRNVVHVLSEIYKQKELGDKAINIYIKMLKEKSKGVRAVLGDLRADKYQQIDHFSCKYIDNPPRTFDAANELNYRLYCKLFNDASLLIEGIKSNLSSGGGSGGGNSGEALSAEFYPLEIKPGEQFTVKYSINDKSAKTALILLTKPNIKLAGTSKNDILTAIKNYYIEGSRQFQRMISVDCNQGVCEGEQLLEDGFGDKDQSISVQVFAISSRTGVGVDPKTVDDILNMASAMISIKPESSGGTGNGDIVITAMAKAATGEKINVSLGFTNMENQEFMLWISDCGGEYVPKISESDHELRTIKSNNFNYRYVWDTEKAGTDVCKHTIRVKTFLSGTMTGMAEKDMEIVASGKDVCIITIDNIDASVTNSNVTLTWDSICGASYYKVYRNDGLIAKPSASTITDTGLAPGTYSYKIEAWAGTPTPEPTVSPVPSATPDPTPELQDVPVDGNTNNDTSAFVPRILTRSTNFTAGVNKALAAGEAPIATAKQDVVINKDGSGGKAGKGGGGTVTDPCKGKVNLGVPLPKVGGGTVTCVANIQEFFEVMYIYLAGIIALVAVLMIVYGGIKYISSQGDPTTITEAKSIIMGGLIGLALVLLAGLFIEIFGQGQKM